MQPIADTWFAILNPAAGKGISIKKWQQLEREMNTRGLPVTHRVSQRPGHIPELIQDALDQGYSKFISIGGDGTHHAVVNGFLRHPEIQSTLAVLSAGSGNDWARTHGLTRRPAILADMLVKGHTIVHPVGRIEFAIEGKPRTRYFMNVAGMGLDGRVVETFPELYRRIPLFPGYLIAGLTHLIGYRAKPMRVSSQDKVVDDHLLTVHAGIGKYSGGGMCFVPHADAARDDLAITCIRRMSLPRLLWNVYRLYLGSILGHSRATGFHAREFSVSGTPVPLEADGEFVGYTPASLAFVPHAFRLIVPVTSHAG